MIKNDKSDDEQTDEPPDERQHGLRLVPSSPPPERLLLPDEDLCQLIHNLRPPRRKPSAPDEPPSAA